MKVDKLYKLICETDSEIFQTEFYTEKTEALAHLKKIQEEALEYYDDELEDGISIKLAELSISKLGTLDIKEFGDFANQRDICIWKEAEQGEFYEWRGINE